MIVMLCCLDSHGLFTGRVTNVDFGDRELSLACRDERGIVCDPPTDTSGMKVGRRWFMSAGWDEGVGNIYWAQTMMHLDEARRLARYLIDERGWIVDEVVENCSLTIGAHR